MHFHAVFAVALIHPCTARSADGSKSLGAVFQPIAKRASPISDHVVGNCHGLQTVYRPPISKKRPLSGGFVFPILGILEGAPDNPIKIFFPDAFVEGILSNVEGSGGLGASPSAAQVLINRRRFGRCLNFRSRHEVVRLKEKFD